MKIIVLIFTLFLGCQLPSAQNCDLGNTLKVKDFIEINDSQTILSMQNDTSYMIDSIPFITIHRYENDQIELSFWKGENQIQACFVVDSEKIKTQKFLYDGYKCSYVLFPDTKDLINRILKKWKIIRA